jgi:hypothetical protein
VATKAARSQAVEPAAPKPLSLRAYAGRRGVSAEAVSKAIETGRLHASVVRDARGAPKIADPELADREWGARTRPRIDHAPVARAAPAEPAAVPAPAAGVAPDDQREYHIARTARETASARREAAQAEIVELELAQTRRELVPAKEMEERMVEVFTSCRTKLLGIPTRAKQRDRSFSKLQLQLVEDLIREALEDLAASVG